MTTQQVHQQSGLLPGDELAGHYEIIRTLGSGAAGTVYLCRDKRIGNSRVAVKVFSEQILADKLTASRIQRELLVLNAISHDHITRFYEAFNHKGVVGYALEYVEGQTLAQLIDTSTKLDFYQILTILISLAYGLKELHDRGLVHRDVKPANVLIGAGGLTKLTDFGLARSCADLVDFTVEGMRASDHQAHIREMERMKTSQGAIVGTLEYISPEYAAVGMLDRRSDIYALGVIAFEMITKRFPVQGDTDIEVLENKISVDPPDVREIRTETPEDIAYFVRKCLARDPKKRFQSCDDIIAVLSPLISEVRSRSGEVLQREALDPRLLAVYELSRHRDGRAQRGFGDFLLWGRWLLWLSLVGVLLFHYRQPILEAAGELLDKPALKKAVFYQMKRWQW